MCAYACTGKLGCGTVNKCYPLYLFTNYERLWQATLQRYRGFCYISWESTQHKHLVHSQDYFTQAKEKKRKSFLQLPGMFCLFLLEHTHTHIKTFKMLLVMATFVNADSPSQESSMYTRALHTRRLFHYCYWQGRGHTPLAPLSHTRQWIHSISWTSKHKAGKTPWHILWLTHTPSSFQWCSSTDAVCIYGIPRTQFH